jgi:hypothetical protein
VDILDQLCHHGDETLFGGGVTGSSSTSNPITTTTTGGNTSTGQQEAGGNLDNSNEAFTGQTVSQTIQNTGVPVSDVAGLLDTAFGTLNTLSENNSASLASVNNAGIAQTQQATSIASSSGDKTLIVVGIGAVILVLAIVLLRRH